MHTTTITRRRRLFRRALTAVLTAGGLITATATAASAGTTWH